MGDGKSEGEVYPEWKKATMEIRAKKQSIVTPLAKLKHGLIHHRVLVFKYLADRLNISTKITKDQRILVKLDNGE